MGRDSTIIFSLSGGPANCYTFLDKEVYNRGRPAHFYYSEKTITYEDEIEASPFLNFAMQKGTRNKYIRLNTEISYYMSRIPYTIYSSYRSYPPGGPNISSSTKITYALIQHHFDLSAGPAFYLKRFYVSPQLVFSNILLHTKINTVENEGINGSNSNSESNKNYKEYLFAGGGGLSIGYDFQLKKYKPFVQLRSNCLVEHSELMRSVVNASLVLGIRF